MFYILPFINLFIKYSYFYYRKFQTFKLLNWDFENKFKKVERNYQQKK